MEIIFFQFLKGLNKPLKLASNLGLRGNTFPPGLLSLSVDSLGLTHSAARQAAGSLALAAGLHPSSEGSSLFPSQAF